MAQNTRAEGALIPGVAAACLTVAAGLALPGTAVAQLQDKTMVGKWKAHTGKPPEGPALWSNKAFWIGVPVAGGNKDYKIILHPGGPNGDAWTATQNDWAGDFKLNTLELPTNTTTKIDEVKGGAKMKIGGTLLFGKANDNGVENALDFVKRTKVGDEEEVKLLPHLTIKGSGETNIWSKMKLGDGIILSVDGAGSGLVTVGLEGDKAVGGLSGKGGLNLNNTGGGEWRLFAASTYEGGTTLIKGTARVGVDSDVDKDTKKVKSGAFGTETLELMGGAIVPLRAADPKNARNWIVGNAIKLSADTDFNENPPNPNDPKKFFNNPSGLLFSSTTKTELPGGKQVAINVRNDSNPKDKVIGSVIFASGFSEAAAGGGFKKTGPGRMWHGQDGVTSPESLITGEVAVNAGELAVVGKLGTKAAPIGGITVAPLAKLTGGVKDQKGEIWSVKKVAPNLTKIPGLKVTGEVKAGAKSPGIFDLGGGLLMDPGAILRADLESPEAGIGYSQINSLDSLDDDLTADILIDGARLIPRLAYQPSPGDLLFLVTDEGDEPIEGQFYGPKGQLLVNSPGVTPVLRLMYTDPLNGLSTRYDFDVSYRGDSLSMSPAGGNDFVLYNARPIPAPGAATLFMAGLAAAARRRRPT